MKRTALLLLAAALLPLQVVAQGTVSGVVRDSRSGSAIELVNVGVPGMTSGTVTDSRGRYFLPVHGADSVTVRYTFTGYRPQQVRVAARRDTVVDILLVPSSQILDEVEIVDEKTRRSNFTNISIEKIEAAVGPSSGVESLLKTLPDVNSSNELSSQYSVRGGSFDENLVYINGVEVFRPMLIRNGQQEGMSIVNPDLVDHILFSPGGFDATYGDKMSSVLDITYRPHADSLSGKLSASLLGAAASFQGRVGERWAISAALRHHNNSYILSSLDTRGSYRTSYTDFQLWSDYAVSERLHLGLLALATRNVYGLVPDSATTAFGGFQQAMQLSIYFDGAEEDRYNTLLAAATFDYRPDDDWRISGNLSFQNINENERYDIQSQYWLYAVGMGEQAGEVERFDRGVGTFLEHARNRLNTRIVAADVRAQRLVSLGSWQFGLKTQLEQVTDRLREWRWVDSAGFALPADHSVPGDSSNTPHTPILQRFANSHAGLTTLRSVAFAQREINLMLPSGADLRILAGLRAAVYHTDLVRYDEGHSTGLKPFFSPRISASLKPRWEHYDILFRLATGIYQQPPFYREYRNADGLLVPSVSPQTSYQVMATADWNFRLWERPFKLTADVFYKYITNLVPYTVDNLRITYNPELDAVAYATGISLRLNGDLVPGLESWASLSLLRTQEDIVGDTLSWLPRPTDQRLSFKLFLQDHIPQMPWWRMSLSFIYATGTPISHPAGRRDIVLRLPSYLRLDWGNTIQLSRFSSLKSSRLFRVIDDLHVGVEVFNLFNFRNVISYLWVTDYDNHPYRVPNYLTARQLNVKITVLF